MTEHEQFYAFVESLRTEGNSETIGTILEGYGACMEAGLMKKIGKAALPYIATASILGAGAAGTFDDSDLIKYQQAEQAKMQYSSSDLTKLIQEHEASIKSGDERARAKAYDALKKANVGIGFNQENNFKFYWDKNLGRAFYANGQEVPDEERQYLPSL